MNIKKIITAALPLAIVGLVVGYLLNGKGLTGSYISPLDLSDSARNAVLLFGLGGAVIGAVLGGAIFRKK